MSSGFEEIKRCSWAGDDPLYIAYHDEEWGVPVHEDRKLFEMLVLEGFQAGLSWLTVLRKRERFREVFRGWDVQAVASFSEADIRRLTAEPGIIRNRLKIEAAVKNARAFLDVRDAFGGFDEYLWRFTGGRTLVATPRYARWEDVPASTPLSERLSRDLKQRGFVFVGPVICYAYMQAVGLVDDHLADCFRAAGRF